MFYSFFKMFSTVELIDFLMSDIVLLCLSKKRGIEICKMFLFYTQYTFEIVEREILDWL